MIMAKGKDGGGNNYTPIKNPELLQDKPDNLTIKQRVAEGKNPKMKKDNETFGDLVKRVVAEETQPYREKIEKQRSTEKDNSKDIQKDKQEPEKDKE
jgi:hypothetical protein